MYVRVLYISAPKTDSMESCRSGYLLPDFSSTNCCCWLMAEEGWDGVALLAMSVHRVKLFGGGYRVLAIGVARSRERRGFRRMFGLFAPITVLFASLLMRRQIEDDEFIYVKVF